MAGLVPAIHVLAIEKKGVDARVKPGHDEPEIFAQCVVDQNIRLSLISTQRPFCTCWTWVMVLAR
jgi:hypothetical protein